MLTPRRRSPGAVRLLGRPGELVWAAVGADGAGSPRQVRVGHRPGRGRGAQPASGRDCGRPPRHRSGPSVEVGQAVHLGAPTSSAVVVGLLDTQGGGRALCVRRVVVKVDLKIRYSPERLVRHVKSCLAIGLPAASLYAPRAARPSLFDAHDGHPNWEAELSQGRRRGGQGPGVRSRSDQVEPA
jgi:hypothetical protein